MNATPTLPATMKAVLLLGHGGYDKLRYRADVSVPRPAPGWVLIKVGAAGINNTDINTRLGWYAPANRGPTSEAAGAGTGDEAGGGWSGGIAFPRIQGADVCGRIVGLGEGVAAGRLGERVLVQPCLRSLAKGGIAPWLGSEYDGGFAEYVAAPAADSYRIESGLSDAELASFPCAYGTAENLLTHLGVGPGERVLITGASGGVGSAAVQLTRRRGAEAIAVAGADKAGELRRLGASRVLERGASLVEGLGKDSMDAVVDVVGGPRWGQLLEVLKPGGRYAISGAIAGPIVELDLRQLYLKDLSLFGCTAQREGVFQNLIGYIERGEIKPLLARTFPLAEIVAAQQEFLGKRHVGKLVLSVA